MKHWKEICTLSLVHFMAFPELQTGEGAFIQSIRRISELDFFEALEMGSINSSSLRADVRKAASDYGFKLAFGAQPIILSQGMNLNDTDHGVRLAAVQCLKIAIDQAAELGAESFVILSGKDPGEENRKMAYHHLTDSIERLADYSERQGISTVLEIFDRCVDKKVLVGPAEEAYKLADYVRMEYPEFGLLYDMGHMPLLEEMPQTALPILAPHLREVHLGNCVMNPASPIYGDKHPRFGYPGGVNGTAELVLFLRELFKIGFLDADAKGEEDLPWLGFEIRPQNGETSDQILENIKTTWQDAWSQVLLEERS